MSEVKFKGFAQDGERELIVDRLFTDPRLLIKAGDDGKLGIRIAPSDAPALALAILEAAGYGEEVATDGSPDGHIQVAKYYLYEGVKAHASITAEAEAQAKLEAEALELRNAYHKGIGYPSKDWSHLNDEQKEVWLDVARRAREMRAEK